MLYLIKDTDFLKIGYSSNIEERMKEYATHNPSYELIGVREGDKEFEKFFHNRFKEFRLRNEWFEYKDIIVEDFLNYKDKIYNYPEGESISTMFVFFKLGDKLLEMKSFTSINIIFYIASHCQYNTGKILFSSDERKRCAKATGKSTNSITNALKTLEDYNLIKRLPEKYIYVNPLYFWRGDLKTRKSILKSYPFED